ncbi:endonuclease/exonuclease/phosphatase family protein [Methylomonas sp. AM2-LC]|uniref:endonuclease/exonuclease/phosphatase family protein n=1 Tax=Methylomonas sp. AM2-LC TaxID=3153301 RepID=UPI0032668848
MAEIIQLLTVENTTNRKRQPTEQTLVFHILIASLTYHKCVEVCWCGEDGRWQTLAAKFLLGCGEKQEYWQAKLTVRTLNGSALPGNIQFALRLRCQQQEYWDNNHGVNFISVANSGIRLDKHRILQNLNFSTQLLDKQQWLRIQVAVQTSFAAEKVNVHWTNDGWQHDHHTACRLNKRLSNAETQIWTARIKLGATFRLHYAISCKHQQLLVWDNNKGKNYTVSHAPLTVLILNLHCYQEDQQDHKFSQIAKAIQEQNVDVVCLQEVAEFWNQGYGDWATNAANIINQRLQQPYHLYTDWSHIGFDKYREGVAILSRYPMFNQQSRYVSESHDIYNIHSRKVVMAQMTVPYMGDMTIFSAHLSWWEDGFQQQFERLCSWADSLNQPLRNTTLLCGDFNITFGSQGYREVVNTQSYQDQYLAANAQGLFAQIYRVNDSHWQHQFAEDYRIDYIFMHKHSVWRVSSAKVLFTEQDYGRVSDHCGYIMTFEPK